MYSGYQEGSAKDDGTSMELVPAIFPRRETVRRARNASNTLRLIGDMHHSALVVGRVLARNMPATSELCR